MQPGSVTVVLGNRGSAVDADSFPGAVFVWGGSGDDSVATGSGPDSLSPPAVGLTLFLSCTAIPSSGTAPPGPTGSPPGPVRTGSSSATVRARCGPVRTATGSSPPRRPTGDSGCGDAGYFEAGIIGRIEPAPPAVTIDGARSTRHGRWVKVRISCLDGRADSVCNAKLRLRTRGALVAKRAVKLGTDESRGFSLKLRRNAREKLLRAPSAGRLQGGSRRRRQRDSGSADQALASVLGRRPRGPTAPLASEGDGRWSGLPAQGDVHLRSGRQDGARLG
jgi:hypothetical protein